MHIIITNDNGRLNLTKATANLTDETRDALGRDRCTWTCQEDKAKLWPLTFDLICSGIFESKKEGRLHASVRASVTWKKGARRPEFGESVTVNLTRDSVGQTLGGWLQQDIVSSMAREKMTLGTHFDVAAREAITGALTEIAAKESEKAQAHLDRSAAARGAVTILKK